MSSQPADGPLSEIDLSETPLDSIGLGAIALGHPIGMSGARIALHLALELKRRGGGVGAAGLCRTDIHVIEGQWQPIQDANHTLLPYVPGHENAGWVEDVGSAVTNVEVGDTVLFAKYAGTEFKYDDEEYLILSEKDILATIQD